jgi:hypothetical protein
MTIAKLSSLCAVAVLAAVLSPAPVSAQPLLTDPETYGTTSETLLPVDAYEFEGMDSSVTTGWVPFVNRRYRTGGTNTLMTAGLRVPNGAQITKVEITGCDVDAVGTMEGSIVECPLTGANCIVSAMAVSTAGQPGCATFTHTLPEPRTVDHSATSYSVIVHLPTLGPSLSFRRMAVYYKLQVSPAPATARFTDVPVGHPLHRFVEALAAAGITGGCGADLYCPEATLTRGQMAVFLATALGLHWPN